MVLTWVWPTPSNAYSTGSSIVKIFCDLSEISLRPAYKVVVFPEPVGPVTNTMPSVFFREDLIKFKVFAVKPSSFNPISELSFSRILNTTLSPKDDGRVDTLKSIFLCPIDIEILPSWGNLRSDMSNLDIILILLITI